MKDEKQEGSAVARTTGNDMSAYCVLVVLVFTLLGFIFGIYFNNDNLKNAVSELSAKVSNLSSDLNSVKAGIVQLKQEQMRTNVAVKAVNTNIERNNNMLVSTNELLIDLDHSVVNLQRTVVEQQTIYNFIRDVTHPVVGLLLLLIAIAIKKYRIYKKQKEENETCKKKLLLIELRDDLCGLFFGGGIGVLTVYSVVQISRLYRYILGLFA